MADRIDKLLGLVEGVSPTQPKTPLKEIPAESCKGQTVAPTTEFLKDTKRYQEDVLRRLESRSIAVPMPRNLNKLKAVLRLDAREFLGSFPTPTYAWDVLTELASLSVCPDVKTLEARDMIHMHAVELQLHLARVIAQVRSLSSKNEVPVEGSFNVEQLRRLADEGTLVDKLIEFAVPRDPTRLLEELEPLVGSPEAASEWLEANQQRVLSRLQQEIRAFPDTLEESETLGGAVELCDTLVLYGLIAAYAAWYSCALERREEMGSFRTSILFCTRILLDEERWSVCRDFARIALDAVQALNRECAGTNEQQGTGMITANLFFARRMCGEKLEDIGYEISSWNMDGLHPKYHFLQAILLEDFTCAENIGVLPRIYGHIKKGR
ncbi:MAG: hypothetical protein AB2672_09610 [Candidatus Thiodiazotropha endolucinida]